MTIELGRFGVWRRVAEISPEIAVEVETLGYEAIWIGGSPSGRLEEVEEIIAATHEIPVITGIVNMWREEAGLVARSYHRIEERHPGRFVLGIGVGHPETTREYAKPLDKIVDYLDLLGEEGIAANRLVLAALGPRVLKLSAERTAGAHPYLTTPRHTRFAREVMGLGPLLAPEQKVTLESDPTIARSVGRSAVGRYLKLLNYRRNLIREGWDVESLGNGGGDDLIDDLVLHGNVWEVAAGLQSHIDAGADHVGIQVLGEDPSAHYRELAEVLFG